MSALLPRFLPITVIVAAFVAGPAIRNTSMAPGDRPFNSNTAAIGTDAVAQIYKGMETTSIKIIPVRPVMLNSLKKLSGTATVIKDAIRSPIISHFAKSSTISMKAYLNISTRREPLFFLSLVTSIWFGSLVLSNIFVRIPPATPVKKANIGLRIAIGNPSIDQVTNIESTPVWGVDIRNDTDDPFEAPFLYKDIPVGRTPQEHNGNGIPNKLAFTTEEVLLLPRYFVIILGGTTTFNIPAIKNPKIRYGAISTDNDINALMYWLR